MKNISTKITYKKKLGDQAIFYNRSMKCKVGNQFFLDLYVKVNMTPGSILLFNHGFIYLNLRLITSFLSEEIFASNS